MEARNGGWGQGADIGCARYLPRQLRGGKLSEGNGSVCASTVAVAAATLTGDAIVRGGAA
eukprot:4853940-Pleurochrysis_carterae.AAC.3